MPIAVTCACGTQYNLKDEMAGLTVRCRQCQGIINVPSLAVQEPPVMAIPLDPMPAATVRPGPPPLPGAVPAGPPPLPGQRDDRDGDDYDYERSDRKLHYAFRHDKFLMKQKHFAINQKYYVTDEEGRNLLFVERPIFFGQSCLAVVVGIPAFLGIIGAFIALGYVMGRAGGAGGAGDTRTLFMVIFGILGFFVGLIAMIALILLIMPKRHIQFYEDDSKRDLLLEVLQDYKFTPINATYTVLDEDGKVLARFRKNNLYNFFRKRWYGYYPNGELMLMAQEDSLALSLLRRFLGGLIGVLGAALLRTNFIIQRPDGEKLLGEFIRKFTILDRYVLDMTRDRHEEIDRRVAVALGILLDTGEMR